MNNVQLRLHVASIAYRYKNLRINRHKVVSQRHYSVNFSAMTITSRTRFGNDYRNIFLNETLFRTIGLEVNRGLQFYLCSYFTSSIICYHTNC